MYKAYQAQPPQVFGGPALKGGLQTQASFDPCRPLERFLTETAPQLKNPSTSLKSAMDNFQAVRRLETTLENPIKPVTKQVQDPSSIQNRACCYRKKSRQLCRAVHQKRTRLFVTRLDSKVRVLASQTETYQQIEKTLKPPESCSDIHADIGRIKQSFYLFAPMARSSTGSIG